MVRRLLCESVISGKGIYVPHGSAKCYTLRARATVAELRGAVRGRAGLTTVILIGREVIGDCVAFAVSAVWMFPLFSYTGN